MILHTFHGHVFHSYFGKAQDAHVQEYRERNLARRSSAIIAISEKQKAELCLIHRICKPDKIRVVPLGFDLTRFTVDMDLKRNTLEKDME